MTGSRTDVEPPAALRPGALSMLLAELAHAPDVSTPGWDVLRPGSIVGRFELVQELGRGGFGVVWEARDLELGRAVAFKAVRPGGRPDLREERLLREAEAAARLAHPNIVTLFDVGRAEQGPYLVLELLRGETLAKRIERGPLGVPEALWIAIELSKGLAHAHEQGVVHRDLTPGNVFLCQDGQVKLLDLGMAHAFGTPKAEGGTPAWMAPEQRRGAPEDERTDVFALGAMLHRMLLGEGPFTDGQPPARSGRAPALEIPGLPALGALVRRMLAEDPVARPRNAGEVLAELVASRRELDRMPATGATVRVRRRPRVGLPVLAGAALLAGSLVARQAFRARSGAPGAVRAAIAPAPAAGAPRGPVAAERWAVPVDASSRIRGPIDAPVTIVEFGDLLCPYTRQAEPILRRLLEEFPGRIRVVWKDYPLNAHPGADAAAQLALEAMREKGPAAFWRAHDELLALAPRFDRKALEKVSADLRLDRAEVRMALETSRHRAAIDADVQTLARLGRGGTPTFFVNGRKVEDATPAVLEGAVAEALKAAQGLLAAGVPAARLYDEAQQGARATGDAPQRITLPPPGDRPVRGGASPGAVVVNEFCDLTLPRCAWFEPALRATLKSYGEDVRLVWWDVSDLQRPGARLVVRAARAARGSPDGFWAMHDAILAERGPQKNEASSPELTLPKLREYARRAGVDLDVFDYEIATDDGLPLQDVEEARALGLGAGQLVIDGEVVSGFAPNWILRDAIDRALARRRGAGSR